jgi:hypothetical protein
MDCIVVLVKKSSNLETAIRLAVSTEHFQRIGSFHLRTLPMVSTVSWEGHTS